MVKNISNELIRIVETTTKQLRKLDDKLVRTKPGPGKWSIQEILGHLIDSAANNHQRFIRSKKADPFIFPGYEQDVWVSLQGYNDSSWTELIELWRAYNLHLAKVIGRISSEKLSATCKIGTSEEVSLVYLIEDYVVHLKHHLKQIESRSV